MELLEEAASRANWDAQHGRQHFRVGRVFISAVTGADAFAERDNTTPESPRTASDPTGTGAAELGRWSIRVPT